MIVLVAMIWCVWKVRLHPVLASYCAVVVGLMLMTQTVTAGLLLDHRVPLIIAVAAGGPNGPVPSTAGWTTATGSTGPPPAGT